MLRDRKKLLDSLRAYKAGEIIGVPGEEEAHFIKSIERRIETLDTQLRGVPDLVIPPKRKKAAHTRTAFPARMVTD